MRRSTFPVRTAGPASLLLLVLSLVADLPTHAAAELLSCEVACKGEGAHTCGGSGGSIYCNFPSNTVSGTNKLTEIPTWSNVAEPEKKTYMCVPPPPPPPQLCNQLDPRHPH